MSGGASREIGRFVFKGGRFTDQALPLESLSELVAFETLVKEVARALFYRGHPDAGRLPDRFMEGLELCFRRVQGGSVGIPLEPVAEGIPGPPWAVGQSYLEQAIAVALRAANAANEERRLPDGFPRAALAVVADLGRTLRPDEFFDISTSQGLQCKYTLQTRQALLERASEKWEDAVDIAGHVTAADVKRRQFTLDAVTGSSVVVTFDADQESVVIDALAHHADREVRIRGRGEYAPNGLRRVFSLSSIQPSPPPPTGRKPFWQTILERAEAVPEAERRIIPADGAENVDTYLYGTPRRT